MEMFDKPPCERVNDSSGGKSPTSKTENGAGRSQSATTGPVSKVPIVLAGTSRLRPSKLDACAANHISVTPSVPPFHDSLLVYYRHHSTTC